VFSDYTGLYIIQDVSLKTDQLERHGTAQFCASRDSMSRVHEAFTDERSANVLWPPRSPDLSMCGFSPWGYLKGRIYE
jgi:hypothetical protein